MAVDSLVSRINRQPARTMKMIQDMIRSKWSSLGDRLQTKWNKLTDNDVRRSDGDRHYLAGRLQERYGIAMEKARVEVKEFERALR
jgi:uncharacterized protein YjbJ (UPF0337 family)